ncbi:restriction endonuclease subunit S [Klebsiella oxytoca]|uniref:restriction endonuclease subunit S n=1 Tax=Klebsiella oxytoca TaxID=571 RepID=UPI001E477FAD|nr:restriction endonuclease subunit S [Klebsiella oxytoca]
MVPEGWLISTLDNFIDIKHGFAFKSDYFRSEGEYVLTTPGHFFEVGGFRDQGNKTKYYVGEIPKGYILKKGDVLLAMTEQTAGLLGSAIYVPESGKYLHNQRLGLVLLRDHERICKEYIYLIYNSPTTRKTIAEQASGTKVKHTSPSRLLGVKVLIPPLSEQKKIVQILSTWDKAIAITEQLIANSQLQKKALMQQLLTSKERFPEFNEGWKEVYLGDIAKITTGSSNRQDSQLSGKYTFFDRSEDIRSSDRYLFDGEAVIVPGEGQDFVPKYFRGKFDLHQRTYAIMNFPTCDGKYLFYAIHYFRAHFLSQAVGSTVKSLRLPMFQKMKLHLPTLAEQKKIASVLSNADQEIELLQQKLSHLKQEKKALMQQLLTGKRRVKTDAT